MNIRKKINILFVLPNFDTGGSEKLVVDLAAHLDRDLFNPAVCAFFNGVYSEKMKELSVPFHIVHRDGYIKSKIAIIRFLNKIVRKYKINVVNTHHTSALLQGLPSFKLFNRTRLIHTEHIRLDRDPDVTAQILKTQRIFMKFIDTALGISQGVCDYMRDELNIPSKKIIKILNGVDVKRFQHIDGKPEKREQYRKDAGIRGDEVAIGLFANYRKQKNHELLINAVNLLVNKRVNNVKVVLAGDGPEREKINKLIAGLNLESRILQLGMRHDIPELMNMIDIYCLPSFFEGLPFSLMEAMATGLPCVATNVDGNREIIRDTDNGILVESGNAEALADSLHRLVKDKILRDKLGYQAAYDAGQLSFESMIKKYEELFLNNGVK